MSLNVIVDTREKDPLKFEKYDSLITQVDKLDCGDYTLTGHDMPGDDNSVIIERKKDCLELVTNLGKEYPRFERELELMSQYKRKVILVGSDNNFGYLVRRRLIKMNLPFIKRQLANVYADYGVPIMFLGSRENVEDYIFRLFYRIQKLTECQN